MVLLVAVVLAFTSQSLRSFQKENEDNDKRQQILRSINVSVPANEAKAKYGELIKEAFLVNENGELKGMLLLQQPINTQYMWQMLMVKQNISWLCPERVFGVRYGVYLCR